MTLIFELDLDSVKVNHTACQVMQFKSYSDRHKSHRLLYLATTLVGKYKLLSHVTHIIFTGFEFTANWPQKCVRPEKKR